MSLNRQQLERLHEIACATWRRHRRDRSFKGQVTRSQMIELADALENGVLGQMNRPLEMRQTLQR